MNDNFLDRPLIDVSQVIAKRQHGVVPDAIEQVRPSQSDASAKDDPLGGHCKDDAGHELAKIPGDMVPPRVVVGDLRCRLAEALREGGTTDQTFDAVRMEWADAGEAVARRSAQP